MVGKIPRWNICCLTAGDTDNSTPSHPSPTHPYISFNPSHPSQTPALIRHNSTPFHPSPPSPPLIPLPATSELLSSSPSHPSPTPPPLIPHQLHPLSSLTNSTPSHPLPTLPPLIPYQLHPLIVKKQRFDSHFWGSSSGIQIQITEKSLIVSAQRFAWISHNATA